LSFAVYINATSTPHHKNCNDEHWRAAAGVGSAWGPHSDECIGRLMHHILKVFHWCSTPPEDTDCFANRAGLVVQSVISVPWPYSVIACRIMRLQRRV
jgi:hypothetical protein